MQAETHLLVFELARKAYGVDMTSVREVARPSEMARIAWMPRFIEGVLYVKSEAIPVIDVRKKLGMAPSERDESSRVVVVDIAGQDVGLLVDAITEIARVPDDFVEPPPSEAHHLLGIARLDGKSILLLDTERVVPWEERGLLAYKGLGTQPEDDPRPPAV